MRLTGSSRVERAQHAHAPLAVAAVVADRLVAMLGAAQRLRVLQDARHQLGVVERVRRRHAGPPVRRRAAGAQRLTAVQAASRRRRRRRRPRNDGDGSPADVAGAAGRQAVRQRPTSAHRLHQVDHQVVVGKFADAAERHLRFLATQRTRELACSVPRASITITSAPPRQFYKVLSHPMRFVAVQCGAVRHRTVTHITASNVKEPALTTHRHKRVTFNIVVPLLRIRWKRK